MLVIKTKDRVTAVLGPTNTGKTHYAIERMLAYKNGAIGLPLRLLAREIYDKICYLRGVSSAALITGEEKIIPKNARFFVCTVEALPCDQKFDFVAIDEVQLSADPERGYIFTERILKFRGQKETLFLGSDNIRTPLKNLFEDITFINRPRLSELKFTGAKKISRLPERSAIIGFSSENVYSMAEFVRRQKGGAAVVLGALSPRTRNSQVELYENGDVEYLVATDAIGMGLNLSIKHIAFSGSRKFDGRNFRELLPHEIAQIAGRAGRNRNNGSFGITGELTSLDNGIVDMIENHNFSSIKKLYWRSNDLDFSSVIDLIFSLEKNPDNINLVKGREADDLIALKSLWGITQVSDKVSKPSSVRLLWDVCQIPDYRKISLSDHSMILAQIFEFLSNSCRISDHWLHSEILKINKLDGDIDTLSKRLSFIRTWNYIANRQGWVNDPEYWQGYTREIEDNLSDSLHERLKQRFVDKRTAVLIRGLKQREKLVAEINDDNTIFIDNQFIGKLRGFLFELDISVRPDQKKTFVSAASSSLSVKLTNLAEKFYRVSDIEIKLSEQGEFVWHNEVVATCEKGSEILKPKIIPLVSDFVPQEVSEKIKRRLDHFLKRKVEAVFEPLFNLYNDDTITGLSKGLSFRLWESLGIIPRSVVMNDVKNISQDERVLLRKHGIRFGQFTIFFPMLIKPEPTKLRLILWGKFIGLDKISEAPGPGLVSVEINGNEPKGYFPRAGLRAAGNRAIRIDMLERVVDLIRNADGNSGFEATPEMLSLTGMSHEQFADLMGGLNYKVEKSERMTKNSESGVTSNINSELSEDPERREVFYTFKFQKRHEKIFTKKAYAEKKINKRKSNKHVNKEPLSSSASEGRKFHKKEKKVDIFDPDSPFAALVALKGS